MSRTVVLSKEETMQQEAHTFGQKNYLKNQILTNCKLQEEEENTSEL